MMTKDIRHISLQQMRVLMAVVEERSFSRAAEKIRLSQPSLTKHIQNLEESLGTAVLERNTAGISLTPEGKVVYESASRMFKLLDETGEKLQRISDNEEGMIILAASSIPATYILPRVIRAFQAEHPQVRFRVRTGDSDNAIDTVLNEEAEIGIIGKPVTHRKLHVDRLWNDRLVLVIPSFHRWCGRRYVTLDDLSGEPFVIRERGSATRSIVEDYLRGKTKRDFASFHIVCELGSSEAVKEAVMEGLGVSIISWYAVARELEGGGLAAMPLKGCAIERNFAMIYRKRLVMMKHHRLFLDFIRKFPLRETYESTHSLLQHQQKS